MQVQFQIIRICYSWQQYAQQLQLSEKPRYLRLHDQTAVRAAAHLVHTLENEKKKKHNSEEDFVVRPKEYEGRITNISSGGCCIKTTLPIKEKQYLSLRVPSLELHEHIIGIIRKTRKLVDNTYNLHIQFLKISLDSKNRINTIAFKYEI